MGCFDEVLVPCPRCGKEDVVQSKGGACMMRTYTIQEAPIDVMGDVNRHSPKACEACGCTFEVGATFFVREVK